MKAASGRPGNETPMLQSMVHSVVLNPPWNVPRASPPRNCSPRARQPGYLARNGFRVIDGRLAERGESGPAQTRLGRLNSTSTTPIASICTTRRRRRPSAADDRLASQAASLQNPRALAEALLKSDPSGALRRSKPEWKPKDQAGQLPQQVPYSSSTGRPMPEPTARSTSAADPYGWDELLLKLIERDSGVRV